MEKKIKTDCYFIFKDQDMHASWYCCSFIRNADNPKFWQLDTCEGCPCYFSNGKVEKIVRILIKRRLERKKNEISSS